MKELRCPHCQNVISVDESDYAELLNQVRTDSFNEELERRVADLKAAQEAERKAALALAAQESSREQAAKDQEIAALQQQLQHAQQSTQAQVDLAVAKKSDELNRAISERENQIAQLNASLRQHDTDKEMAVMKAQQQAREQLQHAKEVAANDLQKAREEISQLRNQVLLNEKEVELREKAIQEQHKRELEMKDDLIAQYKDFKLRLSTKMIGESLEVYCSNQYDLSVRPFLPQAEFGKDNNAVEGTKGDFVFRDILDGIESTSIMFEMKNEADGTENKHKNSDFFNKLDKDRIKKNCEHAVLVSMLELDNDLYNNGIYVVPGYNKMYVIRPQQFLTIISLLVQTGRNTYQVKKELEEARNKEIDVTNFEDKVEEIKRVFGGHVEKAGKSYADALKNIDNIIQQLTTMKNNLRLWVDHLSDADKKLDDLTVRKLSYKNPTMKAKFEEARAFNRQAGIEEIRDEE